MNYFNQGDKESSACLTGSTYFIPLKKKNYQRNDTYMPMLSSQLSGVIEFLCYFKNLQTSLIEIEETFKLLDNNLIRTHQKLWSAYESIYKTLNNQLEKFSNCQQQLFKTEELDYSRVYKSYFSSEFY